MGFCMDFFLKLELFVDSKVVARMEKTFSQQDRLLAIKHMLEKVRENKDKNKDVKNLTAKAELREVETGGLISVYDDD